MKVDVNFIRGVFGMFLREISIVLALRNAISCILSHFHASFMVYL